MLTEDKDKILEKVKELHDLLKEQGLNSKISVDASNGSGEPVLEMYTNNGYWKSSTAVCNGQYADAWHPSVPHYYAYNPEWTSSSYGC